ncbi:MAG: hypothetical protein NVS3B3_03950 [Aquirhabdus sp.]
MTSPETGLWLNQLASTNRANSNAATWEENAKEWQAYAKQMEAKLDWVTDQRNGVNAVRAALLDELVARAPESPLANAENRLAVFFAGVNKERQQRGLKQYTFDEFKAKKFVG